MQSVISPEKKRRRPKVSCTLCRRRKIRCNRQSPCNNCLRSRAGSCVYEAQLGGYPTPESDERLSLDAASDAHSVTNQETESLKARIRQLETQLENAASKQPDQAGSDLETTSHPLSGTFHLLYRREQPEPIVQSLSMKSRLFGQSHWVVSVAYFLRDIMNTLLPYTRDMSDACLGIEKCKTLARRIKARQAPSWPPSLASGLPCRAVADALVTQYLRTFESVYRILHIPTFYRKYESLWELGAEQSADMDFIVQLKLVFALGAVTYDDQFSLRTSAIQWIYEAQIWIAGPKYKARVNTQAMQTNLLLLLAQDHIGAGGELSWVSAGALLRKAMFMGLHRDPARLPERTILEAETHRRLWNTILEVNIQSCLASGGAPLISLDDFDTAPPNNFDDEQLETGGDCHPEEQMTQSSFAKALRRTFPQRLAIIKFLNNLSSHRPYEETLRLDADLRTAYKDLSRTLRASGLGPLDFKTKMVDSLMQRYFSALHVPHFNSAGTAYAFSRTSVIESSLRIWRAASPFPCPLASSIENPINDSDDDLPRLMVCSSGYYPSTTIHAAFMIAIELRNQLQENKDNICPAPLRPDLVSVLDEAQAWSLKVIKAGETNVKGYLLVSLIASQVKGMMEGLGEEQISAAMRDAVKDVSSVCLPMLEQMLEAQNAREVAEPTNFDSLTNPMVDGLGEWDVTPDSLFNFDGINSMNWIFDDDLSMDKF